STVDDPTLARTRLFSCCIVTHRHLHSFPTRRSSDLSCTPAPTTTTPRSAGGRAGWATAPGRRRRSRRSARSRGATCTATGGRSRSEEHTSELQSRSDLVCRLLLEKKKRHHQRVMHVC